MPVSPEEAAEVDKEAVAKAIRQIDHVLKGRETGAAFAIGGLGERSYSWWIDNPSTFEVILNAYKEVGWRVKKSGEYIGIHSK
ncbi:MAG: hypothetical protein O7G88_03605 [bacterium]|nr:hypothetical protein [bacterium]